MTLSLHQSLYASVIQKSDTGGFVGIVIVTVLSPRLRAAELLTLLDARLTAELSPYQESLYERGQGES